MAIIEEFKNFAMKGNAVDLAVGVIVGGAFGKVVTTLVEKILMPPLGLVIGGMDFSQLKFVLQAAGADGRGEVAIGYGVLIQSVIDLLIIAGCLFAVIKGMNALDRKSKASAAQAPQPPPAPPEDVVLLREIRDFLKK